MPGVRIIIGNLPLGITLNILLLQYGFKKIEVKGHCIYSSKYLEFIYLCKIITDCSK